MMAEVKRRRRKPKPMEEAVQFSLLQKDKNGLDGRFISDFKGRGVFSCTEFDKGDFLLEYRGDLISKEEYERRQRIYHDALKVFMFEFRYNGKLLCVDAARDDGSLGRLVNDDHINPNSRIRTISVDGKPHLCLFATRSISPGEEITYDYGDSEWPWRCTAHSEVEPSTHTLSRSEVRDLEKAHSEVEPSTHTLSQSEVRDLEKARSEVEPSTHTLSRSEVRDLEKVAPKKDQLPLDQDCVEKAHSEVEPSTHTLSRSEVRDLEKAHSEVEPSTHTLSQSEVRDLEKDVQSLHRFLEKTAHTAFQKLKETASPQSYAELAKATLARIIVFNRRRWRGL
ncbi:histone-lysine N-methyltransferase SETD5-like [Onychostoma macrolepis]|uniref:histone-lysine N-methyltransferase SETD5-like n=1 Tax=Onychostoma macrolepis TaxID=369639 RepID=UPI00272C2779|nr:histone-lysine N-methyltransferase SETD5-like [Onychostoma macrolepis]